MSFIDVANLMLRDRITFEHKGELLTGRVVELALLGDAEINTQICLRLDDSTEHVWTEWASTDNVQRADPEPEPEPDPVRVTVREVPGGWIACQDNDRSKVIAEAVTYDTLESRLSAHPKPVLVTDILTTTEVTP